MAKADGVPTWNKTCNTKLAELLRKGPGRGGISSQDTSVNTAQQNLPRALQTRHPQSLQELWSIVSREGQGLEPEQGIGRSLP